MYKREFSEADRQFKLLSNRTDVELARLHAGYGQALLATLTSQQQEDAATKADRIRVEIERRAGTSSLLMLLFERVVSRLR
jgi:hypothetical protein